MFAALLFLAPLAAVPPGPPEPVEIVVRAVRDKCRVQLAGRTLSDRELSARADQWAKGQAVRVITPRGAGYKCLAKIAFRLSDRGVNLIEFVDRAQRP